MELIFHEDKWKTGTRALMLKGRHKDGLVTERRYQRVTHDVDQFNEALEELADMSWDNERVYATAVPRALPKAMRLFKERLLANDYEAKPEAFFERLDDRWVSCLMNPRAQVHEAKVWLFDCDTDEEFYAVNDGLRNHYDRATPYTYESKSGYHVVVQPFNRSPLGNELQPLLHDNPLMLWGY